MNMTAQELLNAAYEANPSYVEKTAKALYVLERTAPEFAEDLKKDIDTITDVTNTKLAEGYKVMKSIAIGAGSMLGAGLAAAIATDLYDAAKRGLSKSSNYKRIMAANPGLLKGSDHKSLKDSFDTLHRYAPEFTADPMLGGQILKTMVEIPENQLTLIKDLLNARNTMRSAKASQFKPTPVGLKLEAKVS